MNAPHPVTCLCVAPDQVERFWPVVFPLLDAAYAAVDEETPDNLKEWLTGAKGLLWVAESGGAVLGAVTTSLVRKRSGMLVCRIGACGGIHFPLWQRFLDRIESYAKAEGCAMVTAEGRPGWQRLLPEYRTAAVTLVKRI